MSQSAAKRWKFFSDFGGGKELIILLIVGFIFSSREKYFYYMMVYTLDKLMIGYLKLAFHAPRPYMEQGKIHPISCSKEFGKPSGHSSAAWAISIVVFLDLMHGKHHLKKEDGAPVSHFYGWCAWISLLFACVCWALLIPLSRYILGAHSAD